MSTSIAYRKRVHWILPAILALIFINALPLALLIYISFTDWSYGLNLGLHRWMGWENYKYILSQTHTWQDGLTTVKWIGGALLVELPLGLTIAFLLKLAEDKKVLGIEVFKAIFIIPLVVAPVVVGTMWRFLLNPQSGPINYFLNIVGLPTQNLLASKNALWAIIIADIWEYTPIFILMLFAGLQSIPNNLYEAARVDGAGYLQEIMYISLPYLQPIIYLVVIIRTIDLMRWIVTILIMTGGGPGISTETWNVYLYQLTFRNFQVSLGAALAVIIVAISAILTFIFIKFMYKGDKYNK